MLETIPGGNFRTAALSILAEQAGTELPSYTEAVSKLELNETLTALNIPHPQDFPGGSEPFLVKPDKAENGMGIWVTADYCEVGGAVNANCVAQEMLSGPLVSVCVSGTTGNYVSYPAVDFICSDRYDISEASCPSVLPQQALQAFAEDAEKIAAHYKLDGVMEAQAVYHNGKCNLIDVNFHIPDLTALALCKACGVNLFKPETATETHPVKVRLLENGQSCDRRSFSFSQNLRINDTGYSDGVYSIQFQ